MLNACNFCCQRANSMLFSLLSARQHNVIMRVVGVGVTMHHVIMVANATKCMFDVIVVVVVNMMHAIVVGHRKRHQIASA